MVMAADTLNGESNTLSSVRLETARYSRLAKSMLLLLSSWELVNCTERRAATAPRIHKPPLIFFLEETPGDSSTQDVRASPHR